MNAGIAPGQLRLPPELWDRVVDFLQDDNHALKCTSLVCKAWNPSSRFHLFDTLRFYTARSAFQSVTEIPHIVACARAIEIRSAPRPTMLEFCAILDAMPNLIRLRIAIQCPLGPPPPCYRARPIRQLEFVDCIGLSEELFDVLGLFTSIEHLYFSRAGVPASRPPVLPMLCKPVIRKLSACNRTFIDRIHDVIFVVCIGSLETFSLDRVMNTWHEVEQVGEMLVALRSTLLHLELGPDIVHGRHFSMQSSGLLWANMNLMQCQSLESLKLTCDGRYGDICVILQAYLAACKAAPPSLRSLCISIRYLPQNESWPDEMGHSVGVPASWDDLDRSLVTHARRGLSVTVELRDRPASTELFKSFIAGRLPGAVKQGRLLVV
ncbi:hypothetical protein OH76DRAFT_1395460, partial [Lentinus brumalis]